MQPQLARLFSLDGRRALVTGASSGLGRHFAQTLAAALNHSAFNTANALGPFLAGAAIAAGWGLPSTGAVGCALTLGGLAVWGIAWWDGRRAPLVADKAAQQC